MKQMHLYRGLAILAFALAPIAVMGQDQKPPEKKAEQKTAEAKPVEPEQEKGFIEFGVRHIWGEVYGRPDLPFTPEVKTSKYNEYRDIRNGFFIRRLRLHLDDVFGSNNYLSLQSEKAIYKDQTYLATFGQYGKFKAQFRYDEIPHVFSNTTRTIYVQTAPGVYTIPVALRAALQAAAASSTGCAAGVVGCTLPNVIQTQVVPSMNFITPQILRRGATALASYNLTPAWNLSGSFFREHMSGSRPIGTVLNSVPSAALNGGYGEELPEPIDYFTNRLNVGTEYHRNRFGMQLGYAGSYFENNIDAMVWDNPFRTTDCISPTGCTSATQGPATGRTDLYPSNRADYLTFATGIDLMQDLRFMASITPGWLRQNDPFVPYTTNTLRLAQTAALPASSLNGERQTLAMNYSLVARVKDVQLKATYRHYDFNNNTPEIDLTPVIGDIAAPIAPEENTHYAYNKKNIEFTGNWFFAKKSSFKAGYEGEIMNRVDRDVEHSIEHAFVTALDLNPHRDVNFRVSYRYAVRNPEEYFDDHFAEISGGISVEQADHRRFDEAARVRNKLDAQFSYNMTDKVSFSAFGGTLQDDYNQKAGTNSSTALNFLSGTTNPYYLYGVLKDLSFNYGFDMDYAVTPNATFFGEYSRELYHKRMASRNRTPGGATPLPMDCSISGRACDSANNDWESTAREVVDIYSLGWDLNVGKKALFSTYYSLSAAKGNVFSRPLGDQTLLTGPDKFVLVTTNAAVDYPETTHRMHDATVVFKYKITKNIMPKFEYRFSQFDSRDYQTTPMTPYMGCVSGLAPSVPLAGCTTPMLGVASSIYPYFVVGDTSAARYLFLGVDQPSNRVHNISVTLEYHF